MSARPYSMLSPGHTATIRTTSGTWVLEVVRVDEYGVTGYIDPQHGGHDGLITLVPWPAIVMLTWPVS